MSRRSHRPVTTSRPNERIEALWKQWPNGSTALVLTVDTPRVGRRERDVRNGFTTPLSLTPASLLDRRFERLRQIRSEQDRLGHAVPLEKIQHVVDMGLVGDRQKVLGSCVGQRS